MDEALKLVQSKLLAGVVQEIYELGQLLQMLPVMTIDSQSIIYNRQSTLPTADFYDIHQQIPWAADQEYADQTEVTLKRVARASILDNFIQMTYKDPNDYRTQVLSELTQGCGRTIEDKIIYGAVASDVKEFDGLNVLCPPTDGHAFPTHQDHDIGGGTEVLTMLSLRQCIDNCKPKPNILLTTPTLRNMISAAQFEKGISANTNLAISIGINEFGRRTTYIDGFPLMISDFLSTNEANNTGVKSAATGLVSLYAMRFGQIQDGGLCLCTGGDTGGVNFFRVTELDELEDYDAAGIRLVAYCALALGSTKAMTHIHSIDEDGTVA